MNEVGKKIELSSLLGASGTIQSKNEKYTVLYFYPKDDTPGCTIEANEFNTLKPEYDSLGVRLIGVSVDDAKSHENFCEKFSLNFELVTDTSGKIGRELDIMKGDVHKRVTYVLDSNSTVVLHYPEVKAPGHAAAVLADIMSFNT